MSTSAGVEMRAGSRSETSWAMGKLSVWSAASVSAGAEGLLGAHQTTTVKIAMAIAPTLAGRYRRTRGREGRAGANGSEGGVGANGSEGGVGTNGSGGGDGSKVSDSEDHLACALALGHRRKRAGGVVERKACGDVGLDLASRVKLEQSVRRGRNELRRSLLIQAPVESDHGIVLDQHVVRRRLRDAARGEADEHDPALEGYALRRTIVDVPTNRFEHHVGAATPSDLVDLLNEVLCLVVDSVVGADVVFDPVGGDVYD